MSLYAAPAQDETMAEINVTPFTDVLLVLMIVFIVLAAIALPPGFQKSLANGCGCMHPAAKHASVDVSVASNGRIFVGTRLVNDATVYGALAAIARRDRTTTVNLTGDARAPYGPIVRTLDAAKAAGLENVTFVTR